MALHEYTLAHIAVPAGTLTINLLHPTVLDILPEDPGIVSLGAFTETLERDANRIELGTVDVELVDDYSLSAIPEGFWHFLFRAGPVVEMKFLLDEGAGDTYLFWGRVDRESIRWRELWTGDPRLRTCSFTLVSLAKRLEDTGVGPVLDYLYSHRLMEEERLPSRPVITGVSIGGPGQNDGVLYAYRIAARDAYGEYAWGNEYVFAGGPAQLDENVFLQINWNAVPGATEYAVYRTRVEPAGLPTGFIGASGTVLYEDHGISGSGSGQSRKSNRRFLLLKDLLLAAVALGYEQDWHPGAVHIHQCDFLFDSAVGAASLETVHILALENTGTLAEPSIQRTVFLDPAAGDGWTQRYQSMLELLAALCRQFALIPRHTYSLGEVRHEIHLLARSGRAGGPLSMDDSILESTLCDCSVMSPRSIGVFRCLAPDDRYDMPAGSRSFDQETPQEFVVQTPAASPAECLWTCTDAGGRLKFEPATGVRYYDYRSGAWSTEAEQKRSQAALVHYCASKMRSTRGMAERRYAGLAGGLASHELIAVGVRGVLHDEAGDHPVYANEVRKDVLNDELYVQWLEE